MWIFFGGTFLGVPSGRDPAALGSNNFHFKKVPRVRDTDVFGTLCVHLEVGIGGDFTAFGSIFSCFANVPRDGKLHIAGHLDN